MFPYIPTTSEDEQEMLKVIGVDSIEDLFSDIPKDMQLNRPLNIPKAKSELEVMTYLNSLANKNCSLSKLTNFLGAGEIGRAHV